MMKFVVLFCLIVTSVIAGPPFPLPGGISDDSLSPQCQTPKCPTTKSSGTPLTLPYPLDCLQYIICEESGPRTVACPGDLVFNKVSIEIFQITIFLTILLYNKLHITLFTIYNKCKYI